MSLAARSMFSRTSDAPADDADALRGAELVTRDGRSLPLVGARLLAEAGGGLARVVLEQTFENRHDETLRVTYKMPLPADGAVSGYEFRVGARTVTGRVEAKAQARERFEQALVAGKTAGLLEQQRADIFTQELGNIPPRAAIVARITVDVRLLWLPEGQWEFRFPTVIGPRYVGASDSAADAAAVRIAVAESTDARVHLELRVRDELTRGVVESPSHRLVAGFEAGNYSLAEKSGERLDRDLVARWSVAQLDVGVALAVARPPAAAAHATCAYGLLTIVPPAPEARLDAFPRDLIILLDTSGSMDGQPLAQARKVVSAILDSLDERDQFEVIEFSSAANPWRSQPARATPEARSEAMRWVRARRASGATEMHSAVLGALRSLRLHAQRQVVLVTDGYIGGEQQIVDLCHERLPAGCRLHVVGVGAAVNRSLATALARAGRGVEVIVGLEEDVERPARRLLDRTVAPVLTDLALSGDAVIEQAPEHLPDVFVGAPILVAVKLSPGGGELVVRGNLAQGTWERRLHVPATRPGVGDPGVVALYAREHVADLETRWTIGREAQHIDRTIEKVGLVFQISTRHTSWIAVDDEVSVDGARGSRHEIQPQEVPAGTSIASFGLAVAAPQAPASAASPRVSAVAIPSSRNAKSLIHTGARKPAPLGASEPPAPRPQVASGPTTRTADDASPGEKTASPGEQFRGAGFFTMPATRPVRSRETLIGNLMTLDNDPNAPAPAADDAVREAYYQEVFEEFVKFKVENGEDITTFTYEKFAAKLRANTADLMRRPDVVDVQFSVYLKDGKAALKARVMRGEPVPPVRHEGPMKVFSPRPAGAELRFPVDEEPELVATPQSSVQAVPSTPEPEPELEPSPATRGWIWFILVVVLLMALALLLLP